MLLVDDEPQLLELARLFLEKNEGIRVSTASSAMDASRAMIGQEFDAIVCDYQMPDMDGLEFLKSLRNQKNDVPFILFTGKGREDVAIEALNSGADFYLQKGGDPNSQFAELTNMMNSAVAARRAEKDLTTSEERFRLLAENSEDLVFRYRFTPEPRFEYVSPSAAKIIGFSPEEHYDNPRIWIDLVHMDDRHLIEDMLKPDGEFSRPTTVRMITKNGVTVWMEQRLVPIEDSEGTVVAIEGTIIDVTERIQAEQELKKSEAEYRKLVMTAPCVIFAITPDGKTLFVNDYVRDVTGYGPEELMGNNWWDILYPGHLKHQADELMKEFLEGDVSGYEMILMDKEGTLKTLLWNSFNRWNDDRKTLLEINGAGIDLTARKAAENALRESGAFNRAVLDSLDANIAVLDGDGRIIAVNKSWLVFAGLNDADLSKVGLGANYIGVCERAAADGDGQARLVAEAIREVIKGSRTSFSVEYDCDSTTRKRWFVLEATPLLKRKGGAVVSHIDITTRKIMDEALRESEARYRSIFESTETAKVIFEADSTIVLVNSAFEKLSGYSKVEVQGRMKWPDFVEKDDLRRLEEYHRARMLDPDSAPATYQFRARDRFGALKALLANAAIIPGTKRTLVSMVDETERRQYEDAMQQVNKKLDLLARITRHDILNQLAALSGYLELAMERTTDMEFGPYLSKAKSASEGIRRHLEFARDYQNMGTKRPQWVDVHAACKRAASNIELKEVRVVVELAGLEVFSDPMLEKVFYNLMDNSIKHGQKTSRISFRYSSDEDGMRIIYTDDGVGIADGEKETIFEKSVTDTEGRRGYGLYLGREILGITGITLVETGIQGDGARFEMLVPRGKYRTKDELRKRRSGSRTRSG